jgi:MFS family permease
VSAHPTLRESLRALPQPVWLLCAGTFVNRFGSFVFTFLVLYLVDRGYSAAEAGAVVSVYGVGNLVSALAGGALADRIGRRPTIALSMFSSSATMLALSQADGLALLVVLTALAGLTAELYRPAAGALLADLIPPELRVTGFGAYRLAINAGFAAGPAVAGVLAERSYTWLFVGDAITSAAFGVLALVALPKGGPPRRVDERRGEALRAIAHDRAFTLFLVASTLGALVYFQMSAALPLHVEASGLSPTVYGLLISLNGALIVVLELPLTVFTQRRPRRPVIALGFALLGIGFGLTAVADTAPALAATVLVWTLGEIVCAPVSGAYVADLAPVHLRGRYQGAWGLTFAIALIVAPAAGAALYAASATGLWLLCLGVGLTAAALVLVPPRPR